jgi:hypothetical protein
MRLLLVIVVLLLACGPLRPWVGRHWALLLSMIVGAILGLLAAGWVMTHTKQTFPGLALLFAVIGAVAVGLDGPAFLRRLEKDGKNDGTTDRH